MAAVRHLEFVKIAILVNCPISARDSSSPFRNLHKSENMAPIYSQKTVFNMASVRHLEFEKFRFYVKFSCSEWKFVYVYEI